VRRGEQLGHELAEHLLVAGIGVGMQQRDGDGLGLARRQRLHERARVVAIELAQRPIGRHPLGGGEAQLGGHERCGRGHRTGDRDADGPGGPARSRR